METPQGKRNSKAFGAGRWFGLRTGILTERWMFYGDPLPACMSSVPPALKTMYFLSPRPCTCTSESCLLGTVRIPGSLSLPGLSIV